MRYMLGHALNKVKCCSCSSQRQYGRERGGDDAKLLLHRNIVETRGAKIVQGLSGMAQAETKIKLIANVEYIHMVEEGINLGKENTNCSFAFITHDRKCRPWCYGRTK